MNDVRCQQYKFSWQVPILLRTRISQGHVFSKLGSWESMCPELVTNQLELAKPLSPAVLESTPGPIRSLRSYQAYQVPSLEPTPPEPLGAALEQTKLEASWMALPPQYPVRNQWLARPPFTSTLRDRGPGPGPCLG